MSGTSIFLTIAALAGLSQPPVFLLTELKSKETLHGPILTYHPNLLSLALTTPTTWVALVENQLTPSNGWLKTKSLTEPQVSILEEVILMVKCAHQ
jgi:hypothetical protein